MYALVFGIVSLGIIPPLATDTVLPLSRRQVLKSLVGIGNDARKHCLQCPNILRMVQVSAVLIVPNIERKWTHRHRYSEG